MAELKTQKTAVNPIDFINAVEDEQKKEDSLIIIKIMTSITGEQPVMWGSSIIGFGSYHYKSEKSKQEGNWPLIGFSPRKQNLTLYIMTGFDDKEKLLEKLGKHKVSIGCLYIKRLSDVDIEVLKKLIKVSFLHMKKIHNQI